MDPEHLAIACSALSGAGRGFLIARLSAADNSAVRRATMARAYYHLPSARNRLPAYFAPALRLPHAMCQHAHASATAFTFSSPFSCSTMPSTCAPAAAPLASSNALPTAYYAAPVHLPRYCPSPRRLIHLPCPISPRATFAFMQGGTRTAFLRARVPPARRAPAAARHRSTKRRCTAPAAP